ncbi:unnamed protein product [Brassica oleracea]
MVIKNKLFFPSKTSGSSSHDSSNSPISVGSKSPIQSDTKKPETAPKDETLVPNPLPAGGFVGRSGRFGLRKRFPSGIKSFSHELNSKSVQPFPLWKSHSSNNVEEILVLIRAKFDKARKNCAMITPGDFWLHCEGIVRDLDDRRQELPPGVLKQLHTRMLFILTRCTRLLQFHKSWEEEEQVEE